MPRYKSKRGGVRRKEVEREETECDSRPREGRSWDTTEGAEGAVKGRALAANFPCFTLCPGAQLTQNQMCSHSFMMAKGVQVASLRPSGGWLCPWQG